MGKEIKKKKEKRNVDVLAQQQINHFGINPFIFAEKITEKNISEGIKAQQRLELSKMLFILLIVVVSVIFLYSIFFLFKDDKNFILQILVPLLTFVGGFGFGKIKN